ncbi:MAG TPA: hypothetical protein VHB79_16560 [Polyangiaceae bacterium]|nr:hypothetical protein [Polyangiaceae bacterium]
MTRDRHSSVVTGVNPPPDDRTIARLLSRKNLPSVLEKEAIFERIHERVLAEAAPQGAGRPARFVWVWALGLAVAAAIALVWQGREPAPELAARGDGDANGVALELSCGRAATPCRAAGSLAFELGPAPSTLYFAAFARRTDGTIIWYFPESGAGAVGLKVSAAAAPRVLERSVTFGPEHTAGQYELFALLSKQPLTRAQLKAALGPDLSGGPELRVLRRSFEVAP